MIERHPIQPAPPSLPVLQRRLRPASLTVLAAVAALGLLLTACGPSAGPAGGEHQPAESTADQTYTVRGEVAAVPGEGMPEGQLRIRHEAIPDFVGYDGEVVGMSTMTMPFPAADGIDLEGLSPGDKIEFVLEVSWEGSPPYQITRIQPLPADTVLEFDEEDEMPAEQSVPGTSPTPP